MKSFTNFKSLFAGLIFITGSCASQFSLAATDVPVAGDVVGTKLTITGATATGSDNLPALESAEYSIDLTFDGNYLNEYTSQWGGRTKMPVTLEYTLNTSSGKVDKMVYYPKGPADSNINGTFREFTVYVKTSTADYEKVDDYLITITNKTDAGQIKAPRLVEFGKTFTSPVSVKIVVTSSYHTNANNLPALVSCGEMEFYKNANTSVEEINNEQIRVFAEDGYIRVTGSDEPVKVYTIAGAAIHASAKLSQGFYIVKVGEHTKKVFVK